MSVQRPANMIFAVCVGMAAPDTDMTETRCNTASVVLLSAQEHYLQWEHCTATNKTICKADAGCNACSAATGAQHAAAPDQIRAKTLLSQAQGLTLPRVQTGVPHSQHLCRHLSMHDHTADGLAATSSAPKLRHDEHSMAGPPTVERQPAAISCDLTVSSRSLCADGLALPSATVTSIAFYT